MFVKMHIFTCIGQNQKRNKLDCLVHKECQNQRKSKSLEKCDSLTNMQHFITSFNGHFCTFKIALT